MREKTRNKKSIKGQDRRDHMANERTFLAWIRTSIGIMAFGFVVEKFALFIKELPEIFEKTKSSSITSVTIGLSTIFGMALVAIGAFIGILAFIRYKKVEREIIDNTYRPSIILDTLVAMVILVIGIFLSFYMLHSVH
ncbi:MAG: DUF202 domain-containing protein [Deltaproteobacteria bacterium]|nr:DUF202 domain-containing protein [Deltaproteobacteria bacterium]